jgi:hypothetical protein
MPAETAVGRRIMDILAEPEYVAARRKLSQGPIAKPSRSPGRPRPARGRCRWP